jgi:dephospho-CoA kinase
MLRVGLTGGLGSGKTTVGQIFHALGAYVVNADTLGRELMSPGQPVYRAIVEHFGPGVVRADGTLDRGLLADLAFRHKRVAELNRIVHPPVIAAQQQWADAVFAKNPHAVVVVESALIIEADQQGSAPGWRRRFDRIILVTAPMELRVNRYVERMARVPGAPSLTELDADARRRISAQMLESEKIPFADFVIHNDSSVKAMRVEIERIYAELERVSRGKTTKPAKA